MSVEVVTLRPEMVPGPATAMATLTPGRWPGHRKPRLRAAQLGAQRPTGCPDDGGCLSGFACVLVGQNPFGVQDLLMLHVPA